MVSDRGFTLIELMIVAAIIGLLASIAIPKFANMVRKAREAAIKAKLGSFRSALTIYYADTEGLYPAYFSGGAGARPKPINWDLCPVALALAPKYIEKLDNAVARIETPGHTHLWFSGSEWPTTNGINPPVSCNLDGVGLGYITYHPTVLGGKPHSWANFVIVCDHTDLSNRVWSTW